MDKKIGCVLLVIVGLIVLLPACGGSGSSTVVPLNASDINLVFVVSGDIAYNGTGDIDPATANLTAQGLQRALLNAVFLKDNVLGKSNATAIYALQPMTHLQTSGKYPDLAALMTIEQFAILNRITMTPPIGSDLPFTGNTYPINVSYAEGFVPEGVAAPVVQCAKCQGLDFADQGGNNEALANGIIKANAPGFYVFSAPWETVSALMANINKSNGYNLSLPANYRGPNYIYAISVSPAGRAGFNTFNSNVNPPSTYPRLPSAVPTSACNQQTPFTRTVIAGSGGALTPAGINTNSTIYMIRHAEAHPGGTSFDDGNYVCAGNWRALDLPNALKGKINPDLVYANDPSAAIDGWMASGQNAWSYVRPTLTVAPFTVANKMPLNLAASFGIFDPNTGMLASNFFFTGGKFTNLKVLVAWEHDRIVKAVNALIASYYPGGVPSGQEAPKWPSSDYDSIWTVKLDTAGNLTVDNSICEGIDSAALPATCPQF